MDCQKDNARELEAESSAAGKIRYVPESNLHGVSTYV